MDETVVASKLGALDARTTSIERDVTEIKGDVKTLLIRDAQRSGGDSRLRGLIPFVALLVSIGTAVFTASGGTP